METSPKTDSRIPVDSICIALDTGDLDRARILVDTLSPHAGWFKVGLTLFLAHGREAVDLVRSCHRSLFLDLKFNDIPVQVSGAVARAADMGADMLTVHAGGGSAMLEAAASACGDSTRIVAVTVLTSLGEGDLGRMWPGMDTGDTVRRMTGMAMDAGLDGVVLSPMELAATRTHVPDDFWLVTPGIRARGCDTDDQARTGSARRAYGDGADLLVIGRAVTGAEDPVSALKAML